MNAWSRDIVCLDIIPLDECLLTLGIAQERYLGKALVGSFSDCLKQRLKMPQHASYRRGVEQVGVVGYGCNQPLLCIGDMKRQIEVSSPALRNHRPQGQAR